MFVLSSNLRDSFVGGWDEIQVGWSPSWKEFRNAHDGDMKMKNTCTQTQNTHTCTLHETQNTHTCTLHEKHFIYMIIWSLHYYYPSLCLVQWAFAFELETKKRISCQLQQFHTLWTAHTDGLASWHGESFQSREPKKNRLLLIIAFLFHVDLMTSIAKCVAKLIIIIISRDSRFSLQQKHFSE